MYKHTRKRSAFSEVIHSLQWANTLLPCSLLCQEELSSFCPAIAILWGVNSSYLGKMFGLMYPHMGAERGACSPAQRFCGEARFLRDAMLKLTPSLHRRWILRAASRLGLRPNLPTVHTRDWVEGEPVSVFRESALNELCVFTCCTGRSLRAVPAPSALVAMAHDWQAHKIPQALPQLSPATEVAGIIAPLQLKTSPASIPSLVCSGACFCSHVMSGNAFTPFVVHSPLLSQVPTNYPPLLGPLMFPGGRSGWDTALRPVPLYRAVSRHVWCSTWKAVCAGHTENHCSDMV